MNTLKRFTLSLAALLLFSGVAMVAPVSARDGSSGSDINQSSDNTNTGEIPSSTSTDKESTNPETNDLKEQFREQAQQKLEALKQNVKQHTQAQREKACDARKTSLTKRMNNAVEQAKRHKAVFDKIYTHVTDFVTQKQLTVTDYATLTANVDTAQANAQKNIDALSALDVNVDCTSQTVAQSVGTFRQAVQSARDSLKSYRTAIVSLITSVKGASTSSTNSTTESNQ